MIRNVTHEYDIVTGTDFSISFARHGIYVSGHVHTWNWQPECIGTRGIFAVRLELWSPFLAGTVWWQERTWNPKEGVGEMQFTSTPEGTPILIMNEHKEPLLEWRKGQITYHNRRHQNDLLRH